MAADGPYESLRAFDAGLYREVIERAGALTLSLDLPLEKAVQVERSMVELALGLVRSKWVEL